ncbi:Wadjet anti-phage system protein JetD domain-containing protein [Solimicrobium silvestre]|uniref:Wadjet protein JetD C-terminal domain-containing protein n=1 Tax=Solimicrobium silvestre TaxID=2099400 RepID=A0A2S9GTQ5_9BURK|nr:Wadjet anti-phage system protein JetD domain-containing protein [Solimicrobium silvestre]PRC91090.1 hypothetical protein S2091_4186 [Solimicrobium silvestre]
MKWSTPDELRAQLQKRWERGELLASLLGSESPFPIRLTLKTPTSPDMAEHFDQVRTWIAALRAMPHCRIEMREFNHRLLGANAIPHQIWVDTLAAALVWLGKKRDAERFNTIIAITRAQQPQLLPWLAKRPLRALELAESWSLLLTIVGWLKAHPRPGIYLRQVDIPLVHSKLIEAHRALLSELFDLSLAPETIDFNATGVNQFAQRYGFLDKPHRIRFRLLDLISTRLPGAQLADITLDADSFARLNPAISRVFITENEINFLAFPLLPDSMVIFGAGYGFEMLSKAEWLSCCQMIYWGDIDTHGYAILDQLRNHFPHAQSFLMDRTTLMAFETQWGQEDKPMLRDLPRLTPDEAALFDDLRDNRIKKHLRLEQERIGFTWVEAALTILTSPI